MKYIFMLGRPGSGKTTIAKELAYFMNARYMSSGDVARKAAVGNVDIARALAKGEMAPKAPMDAYMRITLQENLCDIMVVDGYPRYLTQLLDIILDLNKYTLHFIHVHCMLEICLSRMAERGRGDHTPARMIVHEMETQPVINWLNLNVPTISCLNNGDHPVDQIVNKLIGSIPK